ncbi:MAG: hypothetical protein G01um101416_1087 [Microgenomates group bacterium Gr01-1014_16]|nr:MAG: hypothetical protein G01um101416_1087 [Microgenomates group bacterium Gr01-1014_16]
MAVADLTKNEFDEKTKSGVILVDFWAEWCVAPESRVAVSRRESLAAEGLPVGGNILAMGESGVVGDRVERAGVTADGGHCKQVRTEAGRVLETTDDHLFYTNEGWKKSEQLVRGDRVAVLPTLEEVDCRVGEDMELVGQEVVGEIGEEYVRELEKIGLFPLRLTSDKLPIMARILGAVFSDGNLYEGKKNNYREISFALGSQSDVEELTADLRKLGVEKVHVKERLTKNEIHL